MTKPTDPKSTQAQGFALIATLISMMLLALVAVAYLSLAATQLKTSRLDWAQEEARANARLALQIAVAELQQQMGPDRRISAMAAILDHDPETEKIDQVKHPYWMGVWSTKFVGETGTPWQRKRQQGGLVDLRREYQYDREEAVMTWLVSGNEGGRKTLKAQGSQLKDEVVIVGPGSAGRAEEHVRVAKVPISKTKTAKAEGAYAYWVAPLNQRANVAVPDRHHHERLQKSARGLQRLTNAQDVEVGVLDEMTGPKPKDIHKIISPRTLALVDPKNQAVLKNYYHGLTAYSRSLLVNVRDGNLQRDLTAYLQTRRGKIDDLHESHPGYLGLDQEDRLVGPMNRRMVKFENANWNDNRFSGIAPRMSLLYQAFHKSPRRFGRKQPMIPASWDGVAPGVDLGSAENAFCGTNQTPTPIYNGPQHQRKPVLTEASLYYNLAAVPEKNSDQKKKTYRLRACLYPRVCLWNPYNVPLVVPQTLANVFVHGRKQVRVDFEGAPSGDLADGAAGEATQPLHLSLSLPGSFDSSAEGAEQAAADPNEEAGSDSHSGQFNWILHPVTIPPGKTIVFAPGEPRPYENLDFSTNRLWATSRPSPDRYFFVDLDRAVSLSKGEEFKGFREKPFNDDSGSGSGTGPEGVVEGSRNYMMTLKVTGNSALDRDGISAMQTLSHVNLHLQGGGSPETPVAWFEGNGAPPEAPVVVLNSKADPVPSNAIPDTRTRDGFRMRWFSETAANFRTSGNLSRRPSHLQTAMVANWNVRASYSCRNPFDNVTNQPPYLFGAYTRDNADPRVSWLAQVPESGSGGLNLTSPFGPPGEGPSTVILFEVPNEEIGLPSLAYLRHLKLSEFIWHPSYPVGNSLTDPRVPRERTLPDLSSSEKSLNGWNQQFFGFVSRSSNIESGSTSNPDQWANRFRQTVLNAPEENSLIYDLSFETNYNLWDNFFLSTGSSEEKGLFIHDPNNRPLPNGRHILLDPAHADLTKDLIEPELAFFKAAAHLAIDGGFDVHSVSVDAWKAILASTRDTGFSRIKGTPFPRTLASAKVDFKGQGIDDALFTGHRILSDRETDHLARQIVVEVKKRAPFFGLSDFVNRRLDSERPDLSRAGAIESAIQESKINGKLESGDYYINPKRELPDVSFDGIADSTRMKVMDKPRSTLWGMPGFLTQGDVLQVIGSSLRARSDSFVIRTYGEAKDRNGKILARAWCEAIVQRTIHPFKPDQITGLNPAPPEEGEIDLGRRFKIVSTRWLAASEV